MTTGRAFALLAAGALVAAACASSGPSILNPDPVHGGACGDGNQLATLCRLPADASRTWCCWTGARCGTAVGECLTSSPAVGEPRRADAGAPR